MNECVEKNDAGAPAVKKKRSVAGIIGSIQALEAQKYLTGAGELLTGKVFTLDGLTMKSRTVEIPEPSPFCPVCRHGG